MITHLLDTNILSYALRPQNIGIADKLYAEIAANHVAISAVTRAEIRAGQLKMAQEDKRRLAIDQLLAAITTLAWTAEAADLYGDIHTFLTAKGHPIGILDVQIGAHALAEGLTLVTHNTRHFERISGLKLEDWMV